MIRKSRNIEFIATPDSIKKNKEKSYIEMYQIWGNDKRNSWEEHVRYMMKLMKEKNIHEL